MAKTKGLTDDQVVEIVEAEFRDAMGSPGGDIAEERSRAWDYYQRKLFGDEEEDLSKIVTSDVMEVVDGIMPSLLKIFTTHDNLIEFDPIYKRGEDPRMAEEKAKQESDYINHIFFKRNPSFEIMFFWMFDSLVGKNGYVKCFWDESERVTSETYKGLSEGELLELLQDDELEPIEREERVEIVVDPQAGQEVPVTVHDVKFRRVSLRGKVCVENVPYEELRVSADCRSLDLSKARMVGHERYVKRSDLVEMGFPKKKVMDIPAEKRSITNEEARRRDKVDDQRVRSRDADKSQDDILLREAYIKLDKDGDGRAELHQVFTANSELLEMDDADRQPFHTLCSGPLPHKHFGMASAEKVMDNQRVTSTLTRQILNNLYHTNNPGHAVWEMGIGENTMSDLLTRRIGATTRFRRPPAESYAPMTVPFTAAESFPMLQWFDKVKRDRTGIASDSEGLSPEALKHVQKTVQAEAQDIHKAKVETIARIFAETGFKTLFQHMHELVLKYQQDAEILKLRGSYVEIDPAEWRERDDMSVQIGLGIGTREQNNMNLQMIAGLQQAMVEGGGMNLLVTPQNLFQTAREFVANANYKQPELFFTDPGDKKAPPPSTEQEQLQKQQQELEARRQKLDAERNQINQMKVQLDAQKMQIDSQLKVMEIREKAEEREDKYANENQKLQNQLMEARMKAQDAIADNQRQNAKLEAEVEMIRAQAEQARALAVKALADADATDVETAAAESGITGLLEDDGGSEETK
jgi:hypothetical protein